MSKVLIQEKTLTDIADAIREKTNTTALIDPATFAEKQTEVFEAGKKAQYDIFWDTYQNEGKGGNYDFAFAGQGWTTVTFKPTKDIKPARAQYIFSQTAIKGDLVALCEKLGIVIDFSNCKLFNSFTSNARGITRFGVIDVSKATDTFTFINCVALITIDKLIVSATTKYSSAAFEGDTNLENLIVEGEIAQNNFNTRYCTKLSKASIESVINCLSTDTTGLIVTFSQASVDKAFETSEGAADGSTSAEWLALKATKSNWQVDLK